MHPAYSVIFFTVSSGAGYGLLIWVALAALSDWPSPGLVPIILGAVLVVAGLLSSTFHLGHPERAWRAFSQWKTSWLSREGVFAVLSFLPMIGLAGSHFFDWPVLQISAAAMLILAVATVFCTAMIYASLTTIPDWNQRSVAPIYLLMALSSGGVLLLPFFYRTLPALCLPVLLVIVITWAGKWWQWHTMATREARSTAGSATGLAAMGSVHMVEPPHTSPNYVQKEMGFEIARKHAYKLRQLALLFAGIIPLLLIGTTMFFSLSNSILLLLAIPATIAGLLIERWLFFGEARHVVTLFYGASKV